MASPYAFISYVRRDRDFIDRLSADLQSAGIRTWRDIDQIQPGEQWQHAIEDALNEAVALLYVSSQYTEGSRWMEVELLSFFRSGRIVIPVIIDDEGERALPAELRQFQWVDFRGSYEKALRSLLAAFPSTVKSESAIQAPKQKSKGYLFVSYAEEDADFVESLRAFLKGHGYGYWDYAESDRDYHSQFVRELECAIEEAVATLSVLSEDWKRSKWTIREYFFSEELGKPVFLLKAREMKPALAIAGYPYIDFITSVDAGFQKLDRELKRKGL